MILRLLRLVLATSGGRVSPVLSKQGSLQARRRIQLEMEFATAG